MPQKTRLLVCFLIAAIFAVYPRLVAAQQPDEDDHSEHDHLMAACLSACADHMQECNADQKVVEANCAGLDACKGVVLDAKLADAIKKVCDATCNAKESCATGGLSSLGGGSSKVEPKTGGSSSTQKPGTSTTWTMPTSPELICRAKRGAWVETADGLGHECVTLERLNARVNELERQAKSMPDGAESAALMRIAEELEGIKAAVEKLPSDKTDINRRLTNIEGIINSQAAGEAARSRRIDHAYELIKGLQQKESPDDSSGANPEDFRIFGFSISLMGNIQIVRPLDELHAGVGPKLDVHFRFEQDWDFSAAGGVGYAGEDLRGDTLKYFLGEVAFSYRVEEWFRIRFGADVIQRLNPPNASNSSTFGPLFAIAFTPGDELNRLLVELNGGAKGTIFPVYEAEELQSIHAIADGAVNIVLGYTYN